MKRLSIFLLMLALSVVTSCKKNWLDEKPNTALFVPGTLSDCQILLDNNTRLNLREPEIGDIGSDDYFKLYTDWQTAQEAERNMYIWKPEIFGSEPSPEWRYEYEKIYYANAVLETVEKIEKKQENTSEWNAIKGSALFFRALGHYNLVSHFAKPYDVATAMNDLGIPIKTSADVNQKATRGNVKGVYDFIIADLSEAKALLPITVVSKTRPSKAGAQGLLANVYLMIGNYDKALENADEALGVQNTLLDYNTLDPASTSPFPRFNSEVIYHSVQITYGILPFGTGYVDTVLYQSYLVNDLRKVLFFRDRTVGYTFKGSYNQSGFSYFSGIATDELYLIRAESYARKGNASAAMNDLNTLLRTRWVTGTYIDMTASSPTDAISKILLERRKELIFRGRRWSDLRRLNKDPNYAITLRRILNGQSYTLPPNDPRYVYPIPNEEITRSGIEQNPRQ